MKSVEAVMNEKSYFEHANSRFRIDGWVHLVPQNGAHIHNDVQTVFTNVYIFDEVTKEAMYFREFDLQRFFDALNSWKSEAILTKINEWADAVRYERRYDLYQGYQNAIADYVYAMENSND